MRPTILATTTATLLALTPAIGLAQPWTELTVPTSQTLNGVVVGDGRTVTVGNAGVVLASDGGDFGLVDSGTGNDLFDVAHHPAHGFAVSGRDVILQGDGASAFSALVETESGQAYTPVLATDEEVWFGQPSFDGFGFSLVSRYVRADGSTPGIVVDAPILAFCAPSGQDLLRYVTIRGDVVDITDNLAKTTVFDQDDASPMNLVTASFDSECTTLVASDQVGSSVFRVVELEISTARSTSRRALGSSRVNSWEELRSAPGEEPTLVVPWTGFVVPRGAQSLVHEVFAIDVELNQIAS